MDELKNIILSHLEKYPQMELQDFVKLICQNEFADGHMAGDAGKSLILIKQEMMEANPAVGEKLFFPIGNGLFRLNLGVAKLQGIPAEAIYDAFLKTACANRGEMKSFDEKLGVLSRLAGEGSLPFSEEDLRIWLSDYRRQGCPSVGHSEKYRLAYHPHYRITARGSLQLT